MRTATRSRSSTRSAHIATGAHRATALSLRGDLLNAIGDPMAASAYREALDERRPARHAQLRVRLARSRRDVGRLRDRSRRARGPRHRRRRRRRRHPPLARQVRVLHVRLRSSPRPRATKRSDSCSRGSATGRCSTSSRCRRCWRTGPGSWFDRMRIELRQTRENPEIAQRDLRRLPLPGRVPAVRADALRRGHQRGPRPAGDGEAQRRAAGWPRSRRR